MGEIREALAVVKERRAGGGPAVAVDTAERVAEPLLEAIVELSEADPPAARQVLWRLQADWPTLERLERQVGDEPVRAALRVGAAIHLASAELGSPAPQLRQRLPELLDLLGVVSWRRSRACCRGS